MWPCPFKFLINAMRIQNFLRLLVYFPLVLIKLKRSSERTFLYNILQFCILNKRIYFSLMLVNTKYEVFFIILLKSILVTRVYVLTCLCSIKILKFQRENVPIREGINIH